MSEKTSSQEFSSKEFNENLRQQIRCIISNVYDLQKMRVAAGNRLVQSFYIQQGVNPAVKLDKLGQEKNLSADELEKQKKEEEKETKKMIDKLKIEYNRFTDGVFDWDTRKIKKRLKELSKEEEPLQYIRTEADFNLIDCYMRMLTLEQKTTKTLDYYIKQHPLWDRFFADVKGCGTLMAGVCLAYLDPYKARHVSCFFRYCGVDTVQDETEDGEKLFIAQDDYNGLRFRKCKFMYEYVDDGGEAHIGKVKMLEETDANGEQLYEVTDKDMIKWVCTKRFVYRNVKGQDVQVYVTVPEKARSKEDSDYAGGDEYIGEVVASMHGRRKGDTEMFEYIDKDGNKAMKRGLTYNPVVKSKLLGVLAGCLIKAKDPVYSEIFYEYKARLDNSEYHKYATPYRKLHMAQRYMIKQFLRNLWTTWRDVEGLPVDEPYEVAKLGHAPHKYNEYQVNMARRA